MKKQDILTILITFVIGILGGAYLYLTGFAPVESKMSLPDAVELAQFTLVSDVYGGCRNMCPSFQVVNNGSYRYIYTPPAGGDQVVRQGSLPISLQRNLKNALNSEILEDQSLPIEPTICNSYTDGVDVIYDITFAGQQYILDSCGTNVDLDSELWTSLRNIWNYLQSL